MKNIYHGTNIKFINLLGTKNKYETKNKTVVLL